MRQQSRTKQISAKYKGYTLYQTPWTDFEGRKQYAKRLWNDVENREEYHAGNPCYTERMLKGVKYSVEELLA